MNMQFKNIKDNTLIDWSDNNDKKVKNLDRILKGKRLMMKKSPLIF